MTRLESLLGAPFERLKFSDLQPLVDNAVPEGTQLDFKRDLYGDGESLATDVVALANSIGGALIIGVDEKEAIASSLTPVPLSDETDRKMRHWLAAYTTPPLDVEIRRLASTDDISRGGYVIDVPRSSRAPHAVVKGITLRYYRRAGSVNHPLSESEVADAYYARFSRVQQQEGRLEEITNTAVVAAYARGGTRPWMTVILAPAYGGEMEITAARLRALERWADDVGQQLQRGQYRPRARAFPSIGRVSVTTGEAENKPAVHYTLELYTDGASSATAELLQDTNIDAGTLFGDDLVRMTAGCLRVVAEHASSNAGARGTALVRCRMTFKEAKPLRLGQALRYSWWEQYASSRSLENPPMGQPRAIDIDAVLADPVEWMSATRMVLTDVMHDFGLPEVLHINEDGSLNPLWWPPHTLDGWKAVGAVPRTNKEIRLGP